MRRRKLLSFILAASMIATMNVPTMAATSTQTASADTTVATEATGFEGVSEAADNAGDQSIELTGKDTALEETILEGLVNGETEITVDASENKAEAAVAAALEDTNSTDAIDADVVTENGETKVVLDVDPRTEGVVEFLNEGTIMSDTEEQSYADDEEETETVAVESIALDKTEVNLVVDDTETLTATVSPETATDKTVTWTSSDETVATVADGVVTGVKAGTATITATAGDQTATCTVTVAAKTVAATGITLSDSTKEIVEGDTCTLTATVDPSETTDTVTWTSSDETVATVADGVVTGVKAGTATITATAGDQTAACTVTVTAKTVAATAITLDKSENKIAEEETFTLTATVEPTDTTDTVTWTSSDETVATVADGVVTGVKAGTATITATAGDQTATCEVTVYEVDPLTGEEASGFVGITTEGKTSILAAYEEFVSFKEQYASIFGVETPYNTYKDSDSNPLVSTLALTYIYYDATIYEVDGTKYGGFYRLNMLGGSSDGSYVTVVTGQDSDGNDVTEERSYMDADSITFMIKTFNVSNQIGAQFFGEQIGTHYQTCLTEVANAEAAAEAQGSTLSDSEKYLMINDYLANHVKLDMEYLMASQGIESKEEATDPYVDQIKEALSTNEDYNALPEAYQASMVEGVENMWKTNMLGALGVGSGLCISYVNAFNAIVQTMRSDIYQDSEGNWKSYKDVNYVKDSDGNYQQSTDATYVVDTVDSVLNAFAETYGESQYATSDHYWNAVRTTVGSDSKWYYIDPNYTDAYIESMLMMRGECDGNISHMPFMFDEDDWISLFGEEHFVSIDTLYSDLCTDDSLEHTWFSFAKGAVSYGDDGFYYAYDSTDTFEMLDSSNYMSSMMGGSTEDYTPKYKICKRAYGGDDTSDSMTELIAFAASDADDETAGTTVYNPSTGEMEKNDMLTALYDQMVQDMANYPAIQITGSLYDGKFYFNLSNCIMSYDISTGAVVKVKEYNEVYGERDWTKALGCDAFTVTTDASEADVTVENHPLTSLAIIDGNIHTSVATNLALISTPGWRYFPDMIADYKTIEGYGYEFEETNYNSDYVDYDEYMEEYGSILSQYVTQEENDNGEFYYTASLHDNNTSMESLTGDHEYETVSVAATCGKNAFTEERCKDCGAIKADSRVEEEDTALDHHYVKFDETYYRTSDDSSTDSPTVGQSSSDDTVKYETGTSYVCIHCLNALEEAPEVYDTHTYDAADVEWTETRAAGGDKAYADYSASSAKLACNEGCAAALGKLDCYQSDDTLEVTLDEAVDAKAELTYKGSCTDGGATAVYTANLAVEDNDLDAANGTYEVTKEVQLEEGTHPCDAEFTWVPVEEDGVVTGMESCTAVMTCKACGEVFDSMACELKSEEITASEHEAGGIKYTASVTSGGYTYTDVNTDSLTLYKIDENAKVNTGTTEFVYNGKTQTPEIKSVVVVAEDADNPQTLVEGTDYTVETEKSEDAGEYKAVITGTGAKFTGTYEVPYTIEAKDIADATVELESDSVTYSEAPAVKSVAVDELKLDSDDYTVETTGTNVGDDAKVTLTGKGNYKGTVTKAYSIVAKNLANAVVDAKDTLTYNGKAQSATINSVKVGNTTLTADDYDVTAPTNSIKVGKYSVTLTGKGNYTGTCSVDYTIGKAANKVTAKSVSKTYSTKSQSFSIGAKANESAKLTYKSNSSKVKVSSTGKVTISAKFMGKASIQISSAATTDYNAAKTTITVTVNPTKTTLSSASNSKKGKLAIKWKKNTVGTGYQIQLTTDKNFKKSVKSYTITKNKTVSKTVSGLKKGKTYYVKVRTYKTVSGTKYYSGWSTVKKVKIKK